MGLSPDHLYENETAILELHPHWWYLTPRALLLFAALVFGVVVWTRDWDNAAADGLAWIAAAAILAALVFFLLRVVGWRTTVFVVTTERCISRSGLITKSGIEIPLERINTVYFEQRLFERMLRTGDLAIESAGEGSRSTFSNIADPISVQNTIYRQMELNENRKYDRIGGNARDAAEQVRGSGLSIAEQLEKLADLRDRGAITEEEFAVEKARLQQG